MLAGLDLSTTRVVVRDLSQALTTPTKIQGSIHALNSIKLINVHAPVGETEQFGSRETVHMGNIKGEDALSFRASELIVTSLWPLVNQNLNDSK